MSSSKGQPKKPYVDPLRAGGGKPYVDPLKREYVDPLKIKTNSFEFSQKKVEYKPYTSFHVFEPSKIDPLTGRPYKSNRKKKEEVLEPTETKFHFMNDERRLFQQQKVTAGGGAQTSRMSGFSSQQDYRSFDARKPVPNLVFPLTHRSTVGSTERHLKILENLNF